MINLPNFIAANNLKPYVNQEIRDVITIIQYKDFNGRIKKGYQAEILPAICDLYLEARMNNALNVRQSKLAIIAELMVRVLSKVGITALVDEATGYQDIRKKDALQKILDAYLSKELSAWAKRFPDDFYKEMFRLKKWDDKQFTKRPSIVGKYTNDIVYNRLAPNLVEELKNKNPRNIKGSTKVRDHQWLTAEMGHPHLAQHLHAVMALMRTSQTWGQFIRLINRAFPKKNNQIELPFGE